MRRANFSGRHLVPLVLEFPADAGISRVKDRSWRPP